MNQILELTGVSVSEEDLVSDELFAGVTIYLKEFSLNSILKPCNFSNIYN